ncbi:histidine phosphatase family protein [Desulfovibrio desulfuricans]|uniref:Histidine phosphatase family protein n=1 Tax=Desulfovibrio desulfuricans TaxID=876 RepID=A0A4P7UFT0_DESDE|nr:histidine phosphatase family protein [Desulfovibrio desulfuricans]QCC84866.1 histidine phosphatase family protein [Desulfovibrio desulfuricans]
MSGMWLVRHGSLPPNPERRMVGARDIPLSDAGRDQIRAMARQFMPELGPGPIVAICSDLDRCRETAALLLQSLPPATVPLHAEPGLREICLGLWQGLTKAEIEDHWPGAYADRGHDMAHFCPPQGESFMQTQRRALAALGRWRGRYPAATLLVVSHAGVIGTLLAHYLALPLKDVLRIPQYYGCRAFVPEW